MDLVKPDYTYKVDKVIRVIDGDTIDIMIDVGFYTLIRKRIRMLNIDTEQLRVGTLATKARAKAATLRLINLLDSGEGFMTTKMDATGKYGRLLGSMFVELDDGTVLDVNQTLVDEGFEKGDENTDIVNEWISKIPLK